MSDMAASATAPVPVWPALPLTVTFRCLSAWSPEDVPLWRLRACVVGSGASCSIQLVDVTDGHAVASFMALGPVTPSSGKRRRDRKPVAPQYALERALLASLRSRSVCIHECLDASLLMDDSDEHLLRVTLMVGLAPAMFEARADAASEFLPLRCMLHAYYAQLAAHATLPSPPLLPAEEINLYEVIDSLHTHTCNNIALDDRVTSLHLCTSSHADCSLQRGEACSGGKHLYAYQRQAVNWMLSRETSHVSSQAFLAAVAGETVQVVADDAAGHAHDVLWTPLPLLTRGADGTWGRDTRASYYWCAFTGAVARDAGEVPPAPGLWHAPASMHVDVGDGRVPGGFLCDDMGLGKTIEMLSLVQLHPLRVAGDALELAQRAVDGVDTDLHAAWTGLQTLSAAHLPRFKFLTGATLVCVPINLRAQWSAACAAWFPDLRVHAYEGIRELNKRAERSGGQLHAVIQREFLRFAAADIILVCEDTLKQEQSYVTGLACRVTGLEAFFEVPSRHGVATHARSPLEAFHFHRIAVDESQQLLRMHTTQAACMLLSLSRTFAWCISGTPAPTHKDLYPCLAFLGHAPFAKHRWYTDILTQALDGGDGDDVSSVRVTARAITLSRMRGHGDSARDVLSKLLSPILWRATRASVSSTIALPPAYVLVVTQEAALAEREAARTYTRAAVAKALRALHNGAANAAGLCEAALDGLVKSAVHPDLIPGSGKGAAGKQGHTGASMQSVMQALCSEAHALETSTQLELMRALTDLGALYERQHAHAHACPRAAVFGRGDCAMLLCDAHDTYTRAWSITDTVDVSLHHNTFLETTAELKQWVLADTTLLTSLSRVYRAVGDSAAARNAVTVLNDDSVRPFLRTRLHMQLAVSVYECALAVAQFWGVDTEVDDTVDSVASPERCAAVATRVAAGVCDHHADEPHVGVCALLRECGDRLQRCVWPLTTQLPHDIQFVPAITQTQAYHLDDEVGIAVAFENVNMAAVEAAEGSMESAGNDESWPSVTMLLLAGLEDGAFDTSFQVRLAAAVSSGDRFLAVLNRFYAWSIARTQLDACERLRDGAASRVFRTHASVIAGVRTEVDAAGAQTVQSVAAWLQNAVGDAIRSLTHVCADISSVIHSALVEHADRWVDTVGGDSPANALVAGTHPEALRRTSRSVNSRVHWTTPRTSVWMCPPIILERRLRVIARISSMEFVCEASRMFSNILDREHDIAGFWTDARAAFQSADVPTQAAACSAAHVCSTVSATLQAQVGDAQNRVHRCEVAAAEAIRDHAWKQRVLAITDGGAEGDEDMGSCLICRDTLAGQDMLTVTRCGHAFHAECLTGWTTMSSSGKCPTCRTTITAAQLWHVHAHACGREVNLTTLDEHVMGGRAASAAVEHVPSRIPRPADVNRMCEEDARLVTSMGTRMRSVCARVLTAVAADERVCLVSSHAATLARMRHTLNSLGVRAEQLTGSSAERAHVVRRFTTDPGHVDDPIRALCMHTSVDTSGLTLTAANHIFLLDVSPMTSRTHLSQLIGRIARHGQTRDCFIYVMLCVDSVEERILSLRAATLSHMGYVSARGAAVTKPKGGALKRLKRVKHADGDDAARAYTLTRVGLHMTLHEAVDVLQNACVREGVDFTGEHDSADDAASGGDAVLEDAGYATASEAAGATIKTEEDDASRVASLVDSNDITE